MAINRWSWFAGIACFCLLLQSVAVGQETPGSAPGSAGTEGPPATATAPQTPSIEADLALKQSLLADKYARLEKLLFDLAALESAENPARANLLRRAYQQSADHLTKKQMDTVSEFLTRSEFRRATDEQQEVLKDLKLLLELLLSEDRPERLKSEQERIREYIKALDILLRKQIDLHGQNEGGADHQRLADEQGKVSDRTRSLADKIRENEEQSGDDGSNPDDQPEDQQSSEKPKPSDQQSGDEKPKPKPADDQKPSDGQSPSGSDSKPMPDAKPMDGSGKPSESGEQKPDEQTPQPDEDAEHTEPKEPTQEQQENKPSDQQGSPMPGQPSDQQQQPGDQQSQQSQQQQQQQQSENNQSQESQQSNQNQQQMENPARQHLEEAFKRMQEAQQRLEEAKRKEALDEQAKAEEELRKAKAELEEILRQLREEEVGRMLELLESRFRKMLDLELRVYELTKRLDRVPEAERSRDFAIQANNLSNDQRKIALEADKALILLEEEGSSVSFPEAVEQMRDEMYQVGERLAALKVGFVTQESEEAIIAELEELIAALQQAQQELDQRKQQPQQQQPSEPGEMPLVDKLAELKMIRALQMRVNTRTKRFARFLADLEDPVGQVTDTDLRQHVEKLAEKEQRIHELTRDLILGKNQ